MHTRPLSLAILALALVIPATASAHKMWMLPSATNVAGTDPWIGVDAAISNDLFYPDHFPAALDHLVITAPDGQTAKAENAQTGKYRSVFDLHLTQQGTYRMALVNQGLMASYEIGGKKQRWRGSEAELGKAIPAAASNLQVTAMDTRVETFASNGKPNTTALKPVGRGLELVPVTHVTDLVAGESASFRLLLDGAPAANLKVVAIAGATRYRNAPEEVNTQTDAAGNFTLNWPHAGMYWVNASTELAASGVPARKRRVSYSATLEVLPE